MDSKTDARSENLVHSISRLLVLSALTILAACGGAAPNDSNTFNSSSNAPAAYPATPVPDQPAPGPAND